MKKSQNSAVPLRGKNRFAVPAAPGGRRPAARQGLLEVGLRIREARKRQRLTLDDVARRAGLSKGLLSRIENFRAVPSLPVLAALAQGLGVDMGELLRGIGLPAAREYVLVRAGQGRVVEREAAVGLSYAALFSRLLTGSHLEVFVLNLAPGAHRRLLTTHGEQLVFILAGAVDFKLGAETVRLDTGDALFFDGRIPHAPANPGRRPARLLALYFLEN